MLFVGKWPNCNIYATTPRNTYIPPEPPRPTPPRPTPPQPTTPRPTFRTTPKPTPIPKCHCECKSNEIVMFRDGFEWNPSLKYEREINEEQEN